MVVVTAAWLWTLVGVALVISVWSVVFKDNPVFKFAEHTVVGSAAGYFTVVAILAIMTNGISPIYSQGRPWLIVPLVLGIFMFSRWTKWGWGYRYPIAIVVGVGTGVTLRSTIEAQFTSQLLATVIPIFNPDPLKTFSNLVLVVVTICCVLYFIFTAPQKGVVGQFLGHTRKLAFYFLMLTFGAAVIAQYINGFIFLIERISYVLNFFWKLFS